MACLPLARLHQTARSQQSQPSHPPSRACIVTTRVGGKAERTWAIFGSGFSEAVQENSITVADQVCVADLVKREMVEQIKRGDKNPAMQIAGQRGLHNLHCKIACTAPPTWVSANMPFLHLAYPSCTVEAGHRRIQAKPGQLTCIGHLFI